MKGRIYEGLAGHHPSQALSYSADTPSVLSRLTCCRGGAQRLLKIVMLQLHCNLHWLALHRLLPVLSTSGLPPPSSSLNPSYLGIAKVRLPWGQTPPWIFSVIIGDDVKQDLQEKIIWLNELHTSMALICARISSAWLIYSLGFEKSIHFEIG